MEPPLNEGLPIGGLPSPLWRRLAAAVYDGLLVVAIWMVIVSITVIIFSYAPVPGAERIQQALMVLGIWYYFARSWTRGGQTLGMRAWSLGVRLTDGRALSLTVATRRFLLMFMLCMLPLVIGGIVAWREGMTGSPLVLLLLLPVFSMAWSLLDRRRTLHDRLSTSEVIVLPKPSRA